MLADRSRDGISLGGKLDGKRGRWDRAGHLRMQQ